MSNSATLARPYAKAAFELAQAQGNLSAWDESLNIAAAVSADEQVANWLQSPSADRSKVIAIIRDAAGGELDQQFENYLGVLAANDRLSLLIEISAMYARLRQEAEKRLAVQVVSAVALDEDQAQRMSKALAARFDRDIELNNEIDADVLGGAIIYAGDQVIDGTLKGRLEKLRNSLA
jgi:F-type H+-transporting ATPase subunit delta